MISLAWPYMLALLPVPLLAWLVLPRAPHRQQGALRVPFFAALSGAGLTPAGRPPRVWLRLAALAVIWTLLVVAAARPVLIGVPIPLPMEGRDLMVVLDVSTRMAAKDVRREGPATSRLGVAQGELDEFVATRGGDRVGLVAFGLLSVIQVPLTLDRKAFRDLMLDTSVGMATAPGITADSAIGDGIGMGVKGLKEHSADQRVMVLVVGSLGNAGSLSARLAAEIARSEGIRIHAIGLGVDTPQPGAPDAMQALPPDEEALKAAASTTGGRYFRARTAAEMRAALAEIGKLEPPPTAPSAFTPVTDLFFWPLGAAVLLSLALAALLQMPAGARPPVVEARAVPEPAGGAP